ncbi:MAG: hypothetical protein ACI8TL_002043 [Natronomonas sp.]|jgi:hypothetical protein
MTESSADEDRPAAERFGERIEKLADRATEDCAAFETPADPPDSERAMNYLREGAGPAISIYIEGRTGGQMVQFPPDQYRALEGAMNDWLGLYAACYGVETSPAYALREAAQLLLDTHNIKDVAQILTGVPDRD